MCGKKKELLILERLGCFIECANFEQAQRNPQFLFQFPVSVIFGVPTKKFLKKVKKSESMEIMAIFVHSICCFTFVENMKAIHLPRKLQWSVLTRTRSKLLNRLQVCHVFRQAKSNPLLTNPFYQVSC